MLTFRKALVALTALAASFAATTLPAAAAEYPEPDEYQLLLDVAHCKIGGTFLRIHAVATSGGDDISGQMRITVNDEEVADEHDNNVRVSFKTPVVTKSTDFEVEATFVPDNLATAPAASQSSSQVTQASYSAAALPTVFVTKSTSETVTLVPRSVGCSDDDGDDGDGDGDNGGLLPDTGGISPWFLILGALLLATGAGVLTAVRRRTKKFV